MSSYYTIYFSTITNSGTQFFTSQKNDLFDWNYYDFPIDFSKNNSKIVKRYNKKTALNKIIELESDIKETLDPIE